MRKLILFIALSFLLGNQFLFSQVPSYVPTNGLVGYWPFSGNANDASGNGNNGTVNGATLIADRNGIVNSAYSFDGLSNYIQVPHSSSISITGDITMSAWVKTNGSNGQNYQTIISKRQTYWTWEYAMWLSYHNSTPHNTKLLAARSLGTGNGEYGWSTTPYIQNNWENWVVTISNNQMKIYKNGVLDQTQVFSLVPVNQTCPLLFGKNTLSDSSEQFYGNIDDIGIWNRALTPQEVTALYTSCTPPAAPTGALTQTFCVTPAPTIASLTATGTGIQWYAAATGGTALATTTALVNGTTYYASQTVSACESTTRLLVTVSLNDPQITASATTVCSGTPVSLTASTTATVAQNCNLPANLQTGLVGYWPFCGNANDVSGNANNGTVNGATLTTDRFGNANSAYSFDGVSNSIEVNDNNNFHFGTQTSFSCSYWIKYSSNMQLNTIISKALPTNPGDGFQIMLLSNKPRFDFISYGPSQIDFQANASLNDNTWHFVVFTANRLINEMKFYVDGIIDSSLIDPRLSNGTLTNSSKLKFGFERGIGSCCFFNGELDDISIFNRVLTLSEITQLYTAAPAYLWSTGETTATINPSPTATTTYWCDVTVNGVTCRKSVSVNVNSTTPAPTGALTQTFCATPAPTVADLVATGTGIQWYAAATGGTALATTTTLVSGTTYYATQTVSGCESNTRLAVTVSLNDPQITASATTVCSGTPVTLSASTSATVAQNCNLLVNLQTGLVGYWPFCGNANDFSVNSNNGTVNGATLTTDRFGNANSAYSFDGNDFISTQINRGTLGNLMTISAFYKFTGIININHSAIIGSSNSIGTDFFIGKNNFDTNIGVQDGNYNHQFVVGSNAFDGNWHNIIYTFENNIGKIYLDGVLKNTGNFSKCKISDLLNIGTEFEGSGYYFYGSIDDVGFWNRVLSLAEITQLYNANQNTYLWSTGETTATINPTPTATTTYWCDVTVNGVTCRKTVTITVSTTPVPTGTATQTFCATPAPTIASLAATGTGIQWYAAATGGTPLATPTALVNGTTYYASQTISACESTARLAVTVTLNDPQITSSATAVCSGTPVSLTASTTATVAQNGNLPTNLQTGLIGYWPFNGNANDVSGNANNGTVYGATLAADRFGNANSAYSFDGVDDFIESSNFCYNNGEVDQTVSVWFNPTSNTSTIGPGQTFFNSAPHNGFNFGYSYIGNQSIYIFKNSNPGVSAWNIASNVTFNTPTITLNSWHHALVVKQGLEYKFYYNGNFVGNLVSTINPIQYLCKIRFGAITCCQPEVFNGKLDDISLFNRALSASEITQLYNSNQATYLWSTGATTPTINPSPTATTTYWCDVTVNGVTCRKSITITVNPNSTPAFTQVAAICNGGTLPALPTTSTNSITGTWSPALDNTTTTTYTFTPTAGQCATTATMTITVNPNIAPTFTQVAPICNGATLAALPTTSTNSFTGTWSPAMNNTATTTYTFTPTVGLCATTATMTITVNPNIAPTFTQVAPICNGATLAALPTTSTNSFTGTWSPAMNNTATTTYTFTPTVGLCATTATMTITVIPLPLPPTGTITQTFCANIYPTLQNIVVTPSNINWYTSLTSTTPLPLTTNLPVGSTTYYASQFDAVTGCSSNVRLAVVATVLLENTPSTLTDQTFCSTDIKTLADVKTNGLNIVWYSSSSGGNPLLDSYLLSSSQSLYAAIYNAASGCESPIRQIVQITIINCQLVPNNLLTLNDNSLNDNLTIENIENFPINQIEIYNRFGELVWKTEYYNNDSNTFKGRANVSGVFQKDSDLPTGTYYFILKYYDSYRRKYTDLKSFLYINNNN